MAALKILEGIVVSDKADKTIVVTVSSRSKTKFKIIMMEINGL